jgi:hypothetical protein
VPDTIGRHVLRQLDDSWRSDRAAGCCCVFTLARSVARCEVLAKELPQKWILFSECGLISRTPLLHGLLIGDSHQEVKPFERVLSAEWRSSPYLLRHARGTAPGIYCATREGPLPAARRT